MGQKQPHKGIPEGRFEEEQGRDGFYGPVSHLIRRRPSPRWTNIDGPLKPRMFDLALLQKERECWKRLLFNDRLNIGFYQLENPPQEAFRGADGDILFFCHQGRGLILTEYGLLKYRPGRYVLIPKCLAHAFVPEEPSGFLIIESLSGRFREPERGLLGRHGLYSPRALIRPDLKALQGYLRESGREFKKITVFREGAPTRFDYDSCIFDVEEWEGDLFPFALDMEDIMPVMSHRVHLPPSVHTTFLTDGFIVCSFLPRPLERDADALKVPFYHQNTDYDEALFYHKGDFFSRDGLHPGMMSLHPAGFPHGPHPKAVQAVKGKTETNEYAVMIDSRQPLKRDSALDPLEVKGYWRSWKQPPP